MENLGEYESHLRSKGVDPYKFISSKNISENAFVKFIDTDTSIQRLDRLERQHNLEPKLENLVGQSLIERSVFVRENIFDKNVRGDAPQALRTRDPYAGVGKKFLYPNCSRVAEKYFPELIKLSDTLYDEFLKIKNPSMEQIRRFTSVIYDNGIIVHPYIDGNGQTFRLVVQSYLNEFTNIRDRRYFPYRIMNSGFGGINAAHADLIDKFNLAADLSPFSEIIEAQDLVQKIPTYDEIQENGILSEDQKIWIESVQKLIGKPVSSVHEAFQEINAHIATTIENLSNETSDKDVVKRFLPKDRASVRRDKIHGYLDYILSSKESLEMHLNYIKKGKFIIPDNIPNEQVLYLKMAFLAHERTKIQMDNVLQNTKIHEKNYKEAIKKTRNQISEEDKI